MISGGGGGYAGSVPFTAAVTTVRVSLNEWVRIGGTNKDANEVFREILSAGRSEKRSSLSLWVKVEASM